MHKFISTTAAILLAVPAFADGHAATGDAEAGAQQFDRQCVACHVVVNDDDETLAGRNARTGPNLYAMAGRQLGTVEGFRYSDVIVELGEAGEVWTEESFAAYVQDPTAWLREASDDNRARGKMAYRVRSEEDAINLYAFIATFGADDMEGEAEAESN